MSAISLVVLPPLLPPPLPWLLLSAGVPPPPVCGANEHEAFIFSVAPAAGFASHFYIVAEGSALQSMYEDRIYLLATNMIVVDVLS